MTEAATASAPEETTYEFLSQETLQQLHQNFLDDIQKRAEKSAQAVTYAKKEKDQLINDLKELLLAAARTRKEISSTELAELAHSSHALIAQKTQAMQEKMEWFTEKDWSSINNAAKKRKESATVKNAFGDKERIYLRIDADIVSRTQGNVRACLAAKGYKMISYKDGHATDVQGKQTFRIGKLLKKHDPELYQDYMKDDTRGLDKVAVVISRNTEDIARMSTGRAWISCMSENGVYFLDYVPSDIKEGTLVAYLVREHDTEINNPLARALLKPYNEYNPEEERRKQEENRRRSREQIGRNRLSRLFNRLVHRLSSRANKASGSAQIPTDRPFDQQIYVIGANYGLKSAAFMKTLKDFVDRELNRDVEGHFKIPKDLYTDTLSSKVERKGKEILNNSGWQA